MAVVFTSLGSRNRTPEELNGLSELEDLVTKTGGDLILPFPTKYR